MALSDPVIRHKSLGLTTLEFANPTETIYKQTLTTLRDPEPTETNKISDILIVG